MAEHVTIFDRRVTFVKKEASEVGDGTAWPMLAALDQVAEIMYRVRDAWFTSGSIGHTSVIEGAGGDPDVTWTHTITFQGTPGAPLMASVNVPGGPYGTNHLSARGYNTSATIDAAFDSRFDGGYSVGGFTYRDCNSEIGIWHPNYGAIGDPLNYNDVGFRCGLSHLVETVTSDGVEPPPGGLYTVTVFSESDDGVSYHTPAVVVVSFTGEVAYIGDNMMDPTTQFYIGLGMEVTGLFGGISTLSNYSPYDTGVNFVLGLAGDSVSCKIFSEFAGYSGSDFVLTAKEWWPYAKADGFPAWSATSGAPL